MCIPEESAHAAIEGHGIPDACERGHSELIPLGSERSESLRRLLMAVNQMQLRRRFPDWRPASPRGARP